jgi:diguanylate cyclase (GGDEF)-like protein
MQEYVQLNGETEEADLGPVRSAWKTYLEKHREWVENDKAGAVDEPALNNSQLHDLYVDVDKNVDAVIDLNTGRAHADAEAVDGYVDGTIVFVVSIALCGAMIAALMLRRVRRTITEPLARITDALARLAAGDHHVALPELGRKDEVGEMAKAFEVFRADAFALKKAHEDTRRAQEEAQALARHDALTGLANRRLFGTELQRIVEGLHEDPAEYALLMIDLDRFKPVNDLHGHATGDAVLCEVADRLRGTVERGDTAARLGGDEFAVILSVPKGADSTDVTVRFADQLLAAIAKPISVGDTAIQIGASIGIAFANNDTADAEDLLRAADLAMYRAKKDGRGNAGADSPRGGSEKGNSDGANQAILSAINQHAGRPHLRLRSACALAAPDYWQYPSRYVHTIGRTTRHYLRPHLGHLKSCMP